MNTRHNTTPSDNTNQNSAQRSPAPTSALSTELRDALRQWNDTDADTLAASKERLAALGPQTSDTLAAFIRRRAHINFTCFGVFFVTFAATFIIMFGWSLRHAPHEPFSTSVIIALLGLFGVGLVSMFTGIWATSEAKLLSAAKALADMNPVLAVCILTEPGLTLSSHDSATSTIVKRPLLIALQHLLTCETFPRISLTQAQRRNLRGYLNGRYGDLTAAVVQFFMRMEDGSAVAQVRRVAKRSRVWEVREAADEYLARFAPDDAVRQRLPQLLTLPQAGEDTILSCVMRLGSRNEAERQSAQTALRHMDAAQLEQILQMLGREPVEGRRLGNILYAICIATGAVIGSLTYFPCIHSPYYDLRMSLIVAFGCAFGGGTFGWLAGANVNYARRNRDRARMLGCDNGVFPEKRLLESLETLDNPALLGTLISHLPSSDDLITAGRYRRSALLKAIIRILPRLRASDTDLMDADTRKLLNQQLGRSTRALSEAWAGARRVEEHTAYDVAILKAWEQVGDERALPFVEKLAGLNARTSAQKRVQQAALECLPYLQSRADQQRVAHTLLRAAQPPVEPGDVLLRAATAYAAPVETEHLLRASNDAR